MEKVENCKVDRSTHKLEDVLNQLNGKVREARQRLPIHNAVVIWVCNSKHSGSAKIAGLVVREALPTRVLVRV